RLPRSLARHRGSRGDAEAGHCRARIGDTQDGHEHRVRAGEREARRHARLPARRPVRRADRARGCDARAADGNHRAEEIVAGGANQPPPLAGYDAWSRDRQLVDAVEREGGGWIAPEAKAMGELVGSERMQALARDANRHGPELRTHDRTGERIDVVDYHPAYHELMALAFGAGLHSLPWTSARAGRWVARGALLPVEPRRERRRLPGDDVVRGRAHALGRLGARGGVEAEAARERLRPAAAAARAE